MSAPEKTLEFTTIQDAWGNNATLSTLFNELSATRWGTYLLNMAIQDSVMFAVRDALPVVQPTSDDDDINDDDEFDDFLLFDEKKALNTAEGRWSYEGISDESASAKITIAAEIKDTELLMALTHHRRVRQKFAAMNGREYPLAYALNILGAGADDAVWTMLHTSEKWSGPLPDKDVLAKAAKWFEEFVDSSPDTQVQNLREASLEKGRENFDLLYKTSSLLRRELGFTVSYLSGVTAMLHILQMASGFWVYPVYGLIGFTALGGVGALATNVNQHRKNYLANGGLNAASHNMLAWAELPLVEGNYIRESELFKSGRIHELTDRKTLGKHLTDEWQKSLKKGRNRSALRPVGQGIAKALHHIGYRPKP